MTRTGTATAWLRRGLAALVLAPIWVYRNVISPLMPKTCRYYPSCSAYAEEAVKTHGAARGSWLAVKRLARCHPWTPGGVDHVPPAPSASSGRSKRDLPASPVTGA